MSKRGAAGALAPLPAFHNHSIGLQCFPMQVCHGNIFVPPDFDRILHPCGWGQDDNSGARTCVA